MKVHLITKQTVMNFVHRHMRSKPSFEDWLQKLKSADWEDANDIKTTFRTADLLGNGCNRVVFDIAGNNYRIICKYAFGENEVHLFVCWIGTHAEYDKLCKDKNQYSVCVY